MPPRKSKRAAAAKEAAEDPVVEEQNEDEAPSSSKRQKTTVDVEDVEEDNESSALALVTPQTSSEVVVQTSSRSDLVTYNPPAPGRLSNLFASEMTLEGHEGAVYSIAFDPTGRYLCSGSMDRQILLWEVYGKEGADRDDRAGRNYNVLSGHKNAVLELHWNDIDSPNTIVSCSADKTVAIWDAHKGARTRKLTEHTAVVNSCHFNGGASLVASGSDDCTAILWDSRSKSSVGTFYHDYQVCSVCLSGDGSYLYTGGIDNIIRRFDLRMLEAPADMLLQGHSDTVSGLALSPDGCHLLSNAMDSTMRVWDMRPFANSPNGRCESVVRGLHHGAEKNLLRCAWSPDGRCITGGSADRNVHIWDCRDTSRVSELYYLPGHQASVNQCVFHPNSKEGVIASCGSDKVVFVGEYKGP